jgi:3-hydroxyisobutyrate dehydrogenase
LLKDMKNVKQFAGEVGVTLPLVERAVERFAEFVAAGNAMKDPASIALFYEHDAASRKR